MFMMPQVKLGGGRSRIPEHRAGDAIGPAAVRARGAATTARTMALRSAHGLRKIRNQQPCLAEAAQEITRNACKSLPSGSVVSRCAALESDLVGDGEGFTGDFAQQAGRDDAEAAEVQPRSGSLAMPARMAESVQDG